MARRPMLAGAVLWALASSIGPAIHAAWAQTPGCDALSGDQGQLKRKLFASLHPYDACDATFERCLAQKRPQAVVLRLASDICRQIKAGRGRQDIERGLARRAQSMLPAIKRATFVLDDATLAGEPKAPVQLVVYSCARCPFCKVLVTALHQVVTAGALKGKVRLYLRPFPLRDHPGALEGGLAMVSAAQLGRFWPFVAQLYQRYDSFRPHALADWAAEAGMDKLAFAKAMAASGTREALVRSKQEGLRNKVDATPTLFINGRKYVYELQRDVVVDVLLEAYESATAARR